MSLGFRHDNQNIIQAIHHARASRILLFAAASNGGNTNEPNVAFPASHEQVVCVSAMNSASTQLAAFNPSITPKGLGSLATLGISVPSAWPGSTKPLPKSGTSMATPILAGIAALVLQFIRQLIKDPPILYDDARYRDGVWKTIEERICGQTEHMIRILQKLGPEPGAPNFSAVRPQIGFDGRRTLYDLIWGYFRWIIDPDPATQDGEATQAESKQRSKILERVQSALEFLERERPAPTTPRFAVEDRWDAISEQELRSNRECSSWLDGSTRTPCLWLQGEDASRVSGKLIAPCRQQNTIVIRCECNQFDKDEKLLNLADILGRVHYSALYDVLSCICDQQLPTPQALDLNVYYKLDSRNKTHQSLIRVQELLTELLSHAERPILWVFENYEVLEDDRSKKFAWFQPVLLGFLTLAGAVRRSRKVSEPCRCLFVSRNRPAPKTQKIIGGLMDILDVDEAFGRRT
jgi:hypothetical protein